MAALVLAQDLGGVVAEQDRSSGVFAAAEARALEAPELAPLMKFAVHGRFGLVASELQPASSAVRR